MENSGFKYQLHIHLASYNYISFIIGKCSTQWRSQDFSMGGGVEGGWRRAGSGGQWRSGSAPSVGRFSQFFADFE